MGPNGHAGNGYDDPRNGINDAPNNTDDFVYPTSWIHPIEPPAYVDWAALDGKPVPAQEWVVPGWIPRFETTGLGGAGGEGKTLIAQMLATAGAIKEPWLKIEVPVFRSFLVLCEDRLGDTWRRQAKINLHYGCREWNLIDNMRVWPRRGNKHNYLMVFDRDGVGHLTSFFYQLLAEVKAFRPDLVVIDVKSDVFFGNQNDENQARYFVRHCPDRIAEEAGCAVLLVYHPSRTGMRDGTGQSGSAQWDAAFRARLVLTTPEPADKNEPVDDDARVLTRTKATFSRRGVTIEMKWDDGVFVRTDQPAPTGIMKQAKSARADRVFRSLFDKIRAHSPDRRLSHQRQAGEDYAPRVMVRHPDNEGLNLADFENAMRRALMQDFTVEKIGPPSRARDTIVRVAAKDDAPPPRNRHDMLDAIFTAIERGADSPAGGYTVENAWSVVKQHQPELSPEAAEAQVKKWLRDGVLRETEEGLRVCAMRSWNFTDLNR